MVIVEPGNESATAGIDKSTCTYELLRGPLGAWGNRRDESIDDLDIHQLSFDFSVSNGEAIAFACVEAHRTHPSMRACLACNASIESRESLDFAAWPNAEHTKEVSG